MSTPGINDLASERNCYCVKVFEFVYLRCLTKACLWVIGKGTPKSQNCPRIQKLMLI